MLALVVLCCVLSVLVVVCEGRFGGVLKEQEEHISQEMASKFGALAGAAVAAVGALCSYEARVLHLHSSPGESFQVPFALFSLGLPCFSTCRERRMEMGYPRWRSPIMLYEGSMGGPEI